MRSSRNLGSPQGSASTGNLNDVETSLSRLNILAGQIHGENGVVSSASHYGTPSSENIPFNYGDRAPTNVPTDHFSRFQQPFTNSNPYLISYEERSSSLNSFAPKSTVNSSYSPYDLNLLRQQQIATSTAASAAPKDDSIDLFLTQSPSQSLGVDAIKLRYGDSTIRSIPPFYFEDKQSTVYQGVRSQVTKTSFIPAADSYTPFSEQLNDSSPPNSLTGTAVSSRSGSPIFTNGMADGHVLVRGFKSDPYLNLKVKQNVDPVVRSSFLSQTFEAPFVQNATNQKLQSGDDYSRVDDTQSYAVARPNYYDNDRQFSVNQPPSNFRPVPNHPYPSNMISQEDPTQQPVFFVAMPSQDGRGQVLRPIQMMQVPGQPNAFVVPPGKMPESAQPQVYPELAPRYTSGPVVPPYPSNGHVDLYDNSLTDHDNALTQRSNMNNWQQNSIIHHHPNINPLDPMLSVKPHVFTTISSPIDPIVDHGQGRHHMNNVTLAQAYESAQDKSDNTHLLWNQIPSLRDIVGNVKRLSRDQVGCRILQQLLDEEGSSAATLILNEGLHFWGETMVDPFGNYLFQKLLEKITAEERVTLVKSISSRLVNASLNLHGTRSVQKIVELCADDESSHRLTQQENQSSVALQILSQALSTAAARLCIDSHGNHVIQKILMKLPYQYCSFIFDAVAVNVSDVARHRHGCCVIQRCLDSPESAARSHLVHKIIDKALELMQDAYGNYVVQYVLDVCANDDVNAVCEAVVGRVNILAVQKFSSNVLEKCFERCTDRIREMYLNELSSSDRMRDLMMDPFGNYVIQRALSVSSHEQALKLVEAMKPHLLGSAQGSGGIRNTAGGRRIISKICKRFPSFGLSVSAKPRPLRVPIMNESHHENFSTSPYERGRIGEYVERM